MCVHLHYIHAAVYLPESLSVSLVLDPYVSPPVWLCFSRSLCVSVACGGTQAFILFLALYLHLGRRTRDMRECVRWHFVIFFFFFVFPVEVRQDRTKPKAKSRPSLEDGTRHF